MGEVKRYTQNITNDDYAQAGALYRDVMTPTDRDHLIKNIVDHMKNVKKEVRILRDLTYNNRYKKDKFKSFTSVTLIMVKELLKVLD